MVYGWFMAVTITKGARNRVDPAFLLSRLAEERRRIERLLQRVDEALGNDSAPSKRARQKNSSSEAASPRPSPLDQVKRVLAATADLRLANGNLSAERVARLFG